MVTCLDAYLSLGWWFDFLGVEPAACSKWLLTDERNKYNLSSERVLISRTDTMCYTILYFIPWYIMRPNMIKSHLGKQNLALWLDGRSHLLDQKGRSLNKVTKINFYSGFWTISWDKKIMNKTKSKCLEKTTVFKSLSPNTFAGF